MKLTARVLKVMGIFSGAEAFGILCSVVKMKLVAMWLGAVGVGLFGIYNTTVDTIAIITGLGLRQSGVRELAREHGHLARFRRLASILRSWSMLSGMAGAVLLSFFAPVLSFWFFGDYGHWWDFMLLGVALLCNSLTGGEQAILQGSQMFRRLARSSVGGASLGLLISIPMFRWMGTASVPLSIAVYGVSMLFSLFLNRNREVPYRLSGIPEMKEGLGFVKLGGYIAVATFATNLAQMIFLSWLNGDASTVEVGYYQAGNTLVFRYTSLIFGVVGLEFYPRMSANNNSPYRMSLFVSHEIGLLLKIFTPMLILFLLFRGLIVDILYTSDFKVIIPFVSVAIFTVILRSVSTCMAFSILAKGDGKIYLLTESVDAAIGLGLNIWLFGRYGLLGIGVAQVIWYGVYTLMIGGVYFLRYRLKLNRSAWLLTAGCSLVSAFAVFIALNV